MEREIKITKQNGFLSIYLSCLRFCTLRVQHTNNGTRGKKIEQLHNVYYFPLYTFIHG